MNLVEKLQIGSERTRRIIELIITGIGVKYLALLLAMHAIDPSRSVQPFMVFASYMAISLAGVHFIKRLNWLFVAALVALPVWPFSGNMFLFMDSMIRRTVDLPLLHWLMGFLQTVSIISIPVCILSVLVGYIGGRIVWDLDRRNRKRHGEEG